jgi:spoIIIJ-associated protein
VEWVVTTGRTVAEAVESALDKLGVDEHDAEIDVVREPQKGLFGRLRTEAQVRARVRPTTPRPKLDRRDRRRGERGGRDGDRSRGKGRSTSGSGAAAGATGGRGARREEGAASGEGGRPAEGGVVVAHADGASAEEGTPGSRRQSGSAGPRRRRRRAGTAKGANVVSESMQSTEAPMPAEFDIEGQREAVEDFLTRLLAAFGRPDATVTVEVSEDEAIEASIDGPELGLLVGQKGVALQAMQELLRSMVQRRFVGQTHARIRLDVAGYRARRKVALEKFAREVAESVKTTGAAKALDPMGSADRKIVHDVVNEIEGVSTVSEGEDTARRVVIRPR